METNGVWCKETNATACRCTHHHCSKQNGNDLAHKNGFWYTVVGLLTSTKGTERRRRRWCCKQRVRGIVAVWVLAVVAHLTLTLIVVLFLCRSGSGRGRGSLSLFHIIVDVQCIVFFFYGHFYKGSVNVVAVDRSTASIAVAKSAASMLAAVPSFATKTPPPTATLSGCATGLEEGGNCDAGATKPKGEPGDPECRHWY